MSAATGKTVTTTNRDWAVTLRVARTSVRPGRSLRATLIIANRTGRPVRVPGCAADFTYQIDLADAKIPNGPVSGAVACWTTLRPGRNVFHRHVFARYEVCGGQDSPKCPAPLPPGMYHTVVGWTGDSAADIPEPGVITVTVTH